MGKKKILITGSTGFIGKKFTDAIRIAYDTEIITTSFNRKDRKSINIDLTQSKEVSSLLNMVQPTHVFHFAAFVNPKLNEENKTESFKRNFIITNNLINICDADTKFYFLSTDKVYDPTNRNPHEEDITEIPTSFYSIMKLACEEIIEKRFQKHFIFRCPIIHSYGEVDSNSFIDNAILQLINNKQIKAYTNTIRHYLFVDELIEFLLSIIDSNKYGVYNIGSEPASYFDRILSITKNKNLNSNLLSKDYGNVFPEVQTYNINKFKKTFKKTFK